MQQGQVKGCTHRRECLPDVYTISMDQETQKRGYQMTTGSNRILDDFAKLMTDAAGAAQGVRDEVETALRNQAERVLNSMDVVQREEFEAVREMAVKARDENEALSKKLEALEKKLASLDKPAKPKSPRKSTAARGKAS